MSLETCLVVDGFNDGGDEGAMIVEGASILVLPKPPSWEREDQGESFAHVCWHYEEGNTPPFEEWYVAKGDGSSESTLGEHLLPNLAKEGAVTEQVSHAL